MKKNYLNAIVIMQPGPDKSQVKGAKYHSIMNVESQIIKFLRFAASLEAARYVNFYYKPETESEKGKNFAFRRDIPV